MTWSIIIFVILCLAFGRSENQAEIMKLTHKAELTEYHLHSMYISDFACQDPQPTTVPIRKLLSAHQTTGKAYYPDETVLYRCGESTGYCEGGSVCGPVDAHEVSLPFKVFFMDNVGQYYKGDWEMEYHSFSNHTACGCQELEHS